MNPLPPVMVNRDQTVLSEPTSTRVLFFPEPAWPSYSRLSTFLRAIKEKTFGFAINPRLKFAAAVWVKMKVNCAECVSGCWFMARHVSPVCSFHHLWLTRGRAGVKKRHEGGRRKWHRIHPHWSLQVSGAFRVPFNLLSVFFFISALWAKSNIWNESHDAAS